MPKIKDYEKRRYYRFSAIIESLYCLLISFISTNYKLISFRFFLYKRPIESTLFYNKIGIFILSIKIFFSFIIPIKKNKYFKLSSEKNLRNDFVDNDSENKDDFLWPIPKACKFFLPNEFDSDYFDKLVLSYNKSNNNDDLKFDKGEWWENHSNEFKNKIFIDKKKINIDLIKNFFEIQTNAGLISSSSPLTSKKTKLSKYFKIIELIANYHRLSIKVKPEILRNISESKMFNVDSIIYRNQLLSDRVCRHAYYLSQIKKNTDLQYDEKLFFLDLGSGVGCFSRLFMHFFNNAKGILIDLPETNVFASYYLSVNFPKKKIKFLSDLPEDFVIDSKFFEDCDLVILPPFAIKKISNNFIDLVINTASLGEMSVEYGEFYLEEINRITKKYFYSSNRKNSTNSIWSGYGHYKYKFKNDWHTILYESSPTWHLEYLGKIIK